MGKKKTRKSDIVDELFEIIDKAESRSSRPENKQTEDWLGLVVRILDCLNCTDEGSDPVQDIVGLLKSFTGFESVDIRPRVGEGDAAIGRTESHSPAQSHLTSTKAGKGVDSNPETTPCIECMFTTIISGETDSSLPFFTERGSFWANSRSDCLSAISGKDLHGQCDDEGYESLALIPLRSDQELIGILELKDPHPNRLDLTMIQFLENIGASIGIAFARKHANEVLRDSEKKYQDLVEKERDIIYTVDDKGTITFANPAVERILGYRAEELIGKNFMALIPKEIHERTGADLQSLLKTGELIAETVLLDKEGRPHTVEHSSITIKKDDKVVGVRGVVRDITERKKAEEALHQRSHDLQKRVKELKCLYRIGNLLDTPDISLDEMVQRAALLIPPGWQYPGITCARIVLEGTERRTENFRKTAWRQSSDITAGGERYGSVEVDYLEERPELDEGPFLKEERNLIDAIAEQLGMFLERRRAEKEKERMEVQLRQAQKMEAVGRLAGGMAHDFNNLLTAIRGYSDLALMKLPRDGPACQDVEHVREASIRAAKLTEQLLLFSRPQPVVFKPLNLNKAISDLLKMLKRVIGEDFSIVTDLDPVLRTIHADAGHMEQIVINMVVNAKDAMSEGGEITIRTENVEVDKDYCRTHNYARPGEFVRISVLDTGVGMDEETLSHIFEPFFSTKERGKGTGLGLPVVYGIVKEHNGWIDVESTPGRGSCFMVYLPSNAERPKEERAEDDSTEARKGRGEWILVVEDEGGVRELAESVLAENGYVVSVASSVKEAIRIFIKERKDFALVFSDIVLPDGNGVELVERLVSAKPELRVLLASGYAEEIANWEALKVKRYHFLQKPYAVSELLRVIRELLDRKT